MAGLAFEQALAIAACALAREDEATRYAREAYEIRDPNYLLFSRYCPLASRLYRFPQFCEIIAQMGRSDWLRDQPPLRRAAVERDGARVSDIIQVWLDVSRHPSRGAEQAAVIERGVLAAALGENA